MKLLIKFQSFSDIITNSSSELFCTINGGKEVLDSVNDILYGILEQGYDEDFPCYYYKSKEELIEDNILTKEEIKEYPNYWIEIHLPYDTNKKFYKAGLEAALEDLDIEIKYEEF